MSKQTRFRCQLLFVFVQCCPSSPDAIPDFGRLFCCGKVIAWPRYFVLSSLKSVSTLMLSISISFLLFQLWLLRIFVFPGCILGPTFSVLCLKSHSIFEAALLRKQIVVHRHQISICEAVMVVVSWANTHSSFRLPTWNVFFQGCLQNSVEEQA